MLTPKQAKLLRYIADYTKAHGFAPSYDEMRTHLDLRSRSSVNARLKHLADEGYITHFHNRNRGIELRTGTDEHGLTRTLYKVMDDGWEPVTHEAYIRSPFGRAQANLIIATGRYSPTFESGDQVYVIRDTVVNAGTPYFNADRVFRPKARRRLRAAWAIVGLCRAWITTGEHGLPN